MALDLIAEELQRVREHYGSSAIFSGGCGWASAGIFHHARNQLSRLLNLSGGYTRHLTNYSFGAGMVLLKHILGTEAPLWGPWTSWTSIAKSCSLMVCFGGLPRKNLQVESGGCAQHLSAAKIRMASDAGVKFVNVSPLKSDFDVLSNAQWISIVPGTDAALMLALIYEIVSNAWHDTDFLKSCCVGFDRIWEYVQGTSDGIRRDADWAARICGVEAGTIVALARRMATGRTFINVSWSLQRAEHGEQPYWAAIALASVLGGIGLPGGGIGFGYGSIQRQGTRGSGVPVPRLPTLANPVQSVVPAALGADMILNPGKELSFNGRIIRYPDIRLQYLCGSNPFHHQQNLNKLLRAWTRLETIITQDPWWTSSARHSDIVLPSTTALERNDLGAGSLDRYLIAMHRVLPPLGGARNDFDVLADVAERLGLRSQFTCDMDERKWLETLYASYRSEALRRGHSTPTFDEFWSRGFVSLPSPTVDTPPLEDFRRNPAEHPLQTPSGRIELHSRVIEAMNIPGCPGHAYWSCDGEVFDSERRKCFPIHLLSNQPATRLHSQLDVALHGSEAKIGGREPILLHPDDAAERGLNSGDIARVFNDRGQCLAGVWVEPSMRRGVAVMSMGSWFDPQACDAADPLDVHGNPNVLTNDRTSSPLAQGCGAQSTRVQVEAWSNPIPSVTVDRPPTIRAQSSISDQID